MNFRKHVSLHFALHSKLYADHLPKVSHDIIFNGCAFPCCQHFTLLRPLRICKGTTSPGMLNLFPYLVITDPASPPPSLRYLDIVHVCSDYLIGNVTAQSSLIPTANLTNGTTYSGQTSYGGYVYQNSVQYVSGYLTNGSSGINHYLSVGANGTNAVDGLVALLTVKILSSPAGATKTSPCVPLYFWCNLELTIRVQGMAICVAITLPRCHRHLRAHYCTMPHVIFFPFARLLVLPSLMPVRTDQDLT